MRKYFSVFGIVIPVIILLFAVFYGVIIYQGAGIDEESKLYVDSVTPVILNSMDKETLFKYADDTLINSAQPDEFDRIFNWFRTLGELRDYNGSYGQANIKLSISGVSFVASYEADVTFDKARARVTVSLIKSDGVWKISAFSIRSSALKQSYF